MAGVESESGEAGSGTSLPISRLWPAQGDARWVIAIVAVGFALRMWQYGANTSLWFDELLVVRNLRERSFWTLVSQPLGYDQVAPVGFVALEKAVSEGFGYGELALRFPGFVIGLIALLAFWRLAGRVVNGIAVPIAVGLFAIGAPFIRYSSELKQYGIDIAVAVLLTLLALDLERGVPTLRRCVAAGVAGFIVVWFSQAAVLVLTGLGGVLLMSAVLARDRRVRPVLLVTLPTWALAALLGFVSARRHAAPTTLAFMHTFWASRSGFLPLPVSWGTAHKWGGFVAVQFFSERSLLHYPATWAYVALCGLGFVLLWQSRRDTALLLLGPIVITFAASVAQQYPFRLRLVLFLLPAIILGTATSIAWLYTHAARLQPVCGTVILMLLLAPPVYAVVSTPPPYFYEGFKPVLSFVQARSQPGDAVYVYVNAVDGVEYYGPRFGLPPAAYTLGTCNARDVRPYLDDVDRFRGARRFWVIASSVPEFQHPRSELARYLQTIGVRRDSIAVRSAIVPWGVVGADLYDLSDSIRLHATTVGSFATRPFPTPARPLCRDWIRPTR